MVQIVQEVLHNLYFYTKIVKIRLQAQSGGSDRALAVANLAPRLPNQTLLRILEKERLQR